MATVLACTLAGLALGAVDGCLAAMDQVGAGWRAAVYCAGLTVPLAVLMGALLWAAWTVASRLGAVRRLRDTLRAWGNRSSDADREPIIRLHAWAIAGAVALFLFALGVRWAMRRSWRFEDESFAVAFTSGLVVAIALACLAIAVLAAPPLRRPVRWIDQRIRLPLPPWPAARWALLLAAPTVGLLAPFAHRRVDLLGQRVATLLWLICVAACAPVAGCLLRALSRDRRGARATAAGVGAIALAAFVAALIGYDHHPADAKAVERSLAASAGADLVRAVTDVDRDHASSLLGGRDCAPLDGSRSPRAHEIPGNGIDEDCDGHDGSTHPTTALTPTPLLSGALPPDEIHHYNIVWLTIDATRADHIGALGYDLPTSPTFDTLARSSLLFEHALSQSSRTFFSVPSMFLGLRPGAIQWRRQGVQQPSDAHTSIAERLDAVGYHTAIVLPGGMLTEYTGLQRGFTQKVSYFLDRRVHVWRNNGASSATDKAVELLEGWVRRGDQPFFLAVHYIAPHSPYVRHQDEGFPSFARAPEKTHSPPAYDAEIAYADRHIGFLLDQLRHKPAVWANTIVIITSDHGEEFGEHGGHFHGRSCHIESVHVPLLLRVPGLAPRRIRIPVALIDLVPTLLELTGIPPTGTLEGQSLLIPALRPSEVDPQRPFFCSTASANGRKYLNRSIRAGRYAVMEDTVHGTHQLFDIRVDPGEHHDLAAHPPAQAHLPQLLDLLQQSASGNLKLLY